MAKSTNTATSNDADRRTVAKVREIDDLIQKLGSDDSRVRHDARTSLVNIGHLAIPSLVSALAGPNADLRWEAVKTLREIGDPDAAPAFVCALEDQSFDVRWIAAEGLIALGQQVALNPLLQALEHRPCSPWLLEGAHHVLDALDKPDLLPPAVQPVLAALNGVEPCLTVPPAAETALFQLHHLS